MNGLITQSVCTIGYVEEKKGREELLVFTRKKRTYKVGTHFVLIEGLNRSFVTFFNLFAS